MAELTLSANSGRIDLFRLVSNVRPKPVPPGDVLWLDFMEPMDVLAIVMAKRDTVPTNRIRAILHGQRAITAVTALLLADAVDATAEFCINLQTAHDFVPARGRRVASSGTLGAEHS